jgi:hypothetical protein
MSDTATQRWLKAKASIYVGNDDVAWVVTQTPSEVVAMIREADPDDMLEFNLGNASSWNARPLYIRAKVISSVSPPRDVDTEGNQLDG